MHLLPICPIPPWQLRVATFLDPESICKTNLMVLLLFTKLSNGSMCNQNHIYFGSVADQSLPKKTGLLKMSRPGVVYNKYIRFCSRVFGWRAERAGSERTHSRGCLVGGWEGWVGSRVEYSSQMRVGPVPQNLADGAAPTGLAPTKH